MTADVSVNAQRRSVSLGILPVHRAGVAVSGQQRAASVRVGSNGRTGVSVSGQQRAASVRIRSDDLPVYSGPYTVTPAQSAITLSTDGMAMDGNVTVNPIPQNYGLITWNGSVLTVS